MEPNKNIVQPLYDRLKFQLLKEIITRNYKPDDKFSTEQEITKKYNISSITATKAIFELVHLETLYRRQKMGTFVKNVNTYNRKKIKKEILVILPEWWDMPIQASSLYPVFLQINNFFTKNQFEITYHNLYLSNERSNEKLYTRVVNNEFSGIFFVGEIANINLQIKLMNTGIPSILIENFFLMGDNFYPNSIIIAPDNIKGGYLAAEFLIKNNHKIIATVITEDKGAFLRFDGYKKALKKHNIKINPRLITFTPNGGTDGGYHGIEKFLKRKTRPTGIFLANDFMAIGAIKRIFEENLFVPDDISIIGFDDAEIAKIANPGLTTIHVDREKLGKIACEKMLSLIEDEKKEEKQILLEPSVVKRNTVKKL